MPQDSSCIEIVPGLTREFLMDGKVICHTVSESTRAVVDAFVESTKAVQNDWPAGYVGFFLSDFSKSFAGFNTPYGKHQMAELAKFHPERISYTALVIPKNFQVQIVRIVVNSLKLAGDRIKMFFNRDEALRWLDEQYHKTYASRELTTTK